MSLQQAREDVVQAGKQLVKAGLIARTWGNVSARISESQFVITPSGRAYETLTPAEIVTVNIADGSYQGEIKPSSEKGIHAVVYRQRPEINFIIHTHQVYASVVSTLHRDITGIEPATAAVIGSKVPCASYGLPGSQKLRKGVAAALSRSDGKAFLMANHGALCLGQDRAEAFKVAAELEQLCAGFVMRRYLQLSGQKEEDWAQLRGYYLAELSPGSSPADLPARRPLYNSTRSGDHFVLYLNATPGEPFPEGGAGQIKVGLDKSAGENGKIPPEAEIHRCIYRQFKGLRAIIHTTSPDILTVSQTGRAVYPLLDDFAQIVGVSARVAADSPLPAAARLIARKMKGRYAVMIKDNGALCCGPSKSDAAAAAQVLDKGCKAVIGAALFGGARPIHPIESLLMRFVYQTKYARKAAE